MKDSSESASQPSAPADSTSARLFFGTGAAVSVLIALLYALAPMTVTPQMRMLAVGACALLAAIFVATGLLARRFRLARAVTGAAWASVLLIFVVTVAIGEGLQTPNLGFIGVVVCVATVLASPRVGQWLAGACALALSVLAWAEHTQWLPSFEATAGKQVELHLLVQLMVLVVGLVAGLIVSRTMRRSLDEITRREQRFRGLLRIAVDRYWETDSALRITLVSDPRDTQSADLSREYIGRTPWELDNLGLSDDQLDAFRADLEAHRPFSGVVNERRDRRGRVRYISNSGEPKFDADGVFQGYWAVGREVTAEVTAQQSLAASEARYRDLFELSPSPLVLHRRGVVLDANGAAMRLFGFADVTTIIGTSLFDLFAEGEQRERANARAAAFECLPVGEVLPVVDYQMQSLQGRAISVQVTGVRVDAVGGPAVLAIFFDITGRKAAEAALRRSEAMLSHLFATSPDLMTLTELPSGRFTMVNESFTRMTGYTSAEAVGRTALELGLWHSTEQRERFIASMLEHGSVSDLRAVFVTKSGKLATMLGSAARFMMDGRVYMVINARDVTEAERAQLEHEAILQRASIGIGLTRERRFVRVNPRFERMFGWDSGELNGQPGSAVWPSEEDYAEVGRLAGPLLGAGQPVDMERPMRRRDGSLFWCRLMAQAVDRNAPGTGDTIWIAEDVTERRQTAQALAAARDAAEAASRAKSAFLANTSHEIRTPLNGLLGLARLALQPALDEERRQRYLSQILDSAQSLAGIISDILDLSKIEAGKITLEDLPFALPETLVAVHHAYLSLAQGKGLELALTIDDTVPTTVSGDALRLRQILSNYITNALKFTERGQVRLHAEGVAGGRVRLNVEDTGPGIDLATQQRLFMPFTQADESTTRRFGGTGLGLSICRELAHLMGGEVGVLSNPGLGSRFWVELPLRAVAAADRVGNGETDDLDLLRDTRVLMVEDNPVNMMIAVATLEQWGIDVEQATDGARAVEAVLHAARAGRPFDMVLMDVHMPVMSGHEAARALREHADGATLPIIALTAAALVSEREEAVAAGMNDFLTKPIDSGKLLQTLARYARRTAEV